jgi:dUTPase
MKIARLITEKVVYAGCELSVSLEDTERGSKGFGSRGYK